MLLTALFSGSLILLSYTILDYLPTVALPVLSWALPHQSSVQKMHHSLAYRPIFGWTGMFNRGSIVQ